MSKKIANVLNNCSSLFSENLLFFGRAKFLDYTSTENTHEEYLGYCRLWVQLEESKKVLFRYLGKNVGKIPLSKDYTILDVNDSDFAFTDSRARALDELVFPLVQTQKDLLAIELINFKDWVIFDRYDFEEGFLPSNSDEFYSFLDTYARIVQTTNEDSREFRLEKVLSEIDSRIEGNPDETNCIHLFGRGQRIRQENYKQRIREYKENQLRGIPL
jgi:hypothetical protein